MILIPKQNNSSSLCQPDSTATDDKIKTILQAQDADPVCQKIKCLCQSGWSELESELKPYAIVKHELTIVREMLLQGTRIVIPSKCK